MRGVFPRLRGGGWTRRLLRGGASAALALTFWSVSVAEAPAQIVKPIVADVSKHVVAITTGFVGTDVLLFGATDGDGDVVLVVRGPTQTHVVRQKEKLAGIMWVNTDTVTYESVPGFFHVASSRPLAEILSLAAQQQQRMVPDAFDLSPRNPADDAPARQGFRDALVRLKQNIGLYALDEQTVTLLPNRLFRSDLTLPPNVPTGAYSVEVYLVRDGEVVSAEITPLVISKVGFGADVYDFAHQHGALYGLAAIAIAVVAGWGAGMVFRK